MNKLLTTLAVGGALAGGILLMQSPVSSLNGLRLEACVVTNYSLQNFKHVEGDGSSPGEIYSGKGFVLTIHNYGTNTYRIESSDDMVAWDNFPEPNVIMFMGAKGLTNFVYKAEKPKRFFRPVECSF